MVGLFWKGGRQETEDGNKYRKRQLRTPAARRQGQGTIARHSQGKSFQVYPPGNRWVTDGRGWAERRTSRSAVPRRMGWTRADSDTLPDLDGCLVLAMMVAYVITTTGLCVAISRQFFRCSFSPAICPPYPNYIFRETILSSGVGTRDTGFVQGQFS